MIRTYLATVALALATLVTDDARAGRPLQTEDAGVLERGECELEVSFARERSGDPSVSTGRAQPSCGFGLQSQVGAFVGRAQGDGERSDLTGIVGKTYLRQLTDEQTGFTIAWAAGWLRPRGTAWQREAVEVRGVVTHPMGPWLLHGNLGWLRSERDHRDSAIWGAAVERTDLGPFDAMFEFFGDDREKPWANAGLRWRALPERLHVDGSYGRQTGRDGRTLVTVGMKLAF